MPFKVSCLSCEHQFRFDEPERDGRITCPECGHRFKVRTGPKNTPTPKKKARSLPKSLPELVKHLKRLHPEALEEDLAFVVALVGVDRVWVDDDGLGDLKRTPRPSIKPEAAELEQIRSALAERPERASQAAATGRTIPWKVWAVMVLVGTPTLAALGLFLFEAGTARMVCLLLGIGLAVLGGHEIWQQLSGAEVGKDVKQGSPEEALHLFYNSGILAGDFVRAAGVVGPEGLDPAELGSLWRRSLDIQHKLLTMPQFVTRIYERLGPGYDTSEPEYSTEVQAEVTPLGEDTAVASVTIRLAMRLEITEQPSYKDWNRQAPDHAGLASEYVGWVGLVHDGRMWSLTDGTFSNFRLTSFVGEGALEQVKYERGATAVGQMEVGVVEEFILHTDTKRKRGYF
jgi:DNA-directed RNA polymerase subunit RPC12/RpoP